MNNVIVSPGSTLYVPAGSPENYAITTQACPSTNYYPHIEYRTRELEGLPKFYHDVGSVVVWGLAAAIVGAALYWFFYCIFSHALRNSPLSKKGKR